MEKSLGELARIWETEISHGELGKKEKYLPTLLALLDLKKLISKELCLLRPNRAGSCKHGAAHPYPSLPMEGMTVNQGKDKFVFLMVNFDRDKYTDVVYEIKFKFGGELKDMGAPEPVAKFSSFNIRVARI
ncbi:uncharacterized protein Pyn_37684 [Prunus yedoensis var. nudiflora]|uniref:Uncharacterized protein n=1 Tax=Prunus yedoensis var. nudiflora TaxID=2094558 RepID=A0A314ZIN1_PRUYE|nr:uncharacterized protein Pyn_37684 [Prunus yedoensis var. nudiflora]